MPNKHYRFIIDNKPMAILSPNVKGQTLTRKTYLVIAAYIKRMDTQQVLRI